MRIGIEAQRLFRKKKHGMDMVALELIRQLQVTDHSNEYFIFVKPDEDDQVLQETDNFHIVPLAGGVYPLWEQISLPRAAKRLGCDLLHCTGNTAPLDHSMPLVVTLHDVIYMEGTVQAMITGEGTPYQRFGNLYRRFVVPRVLDRADAVVTVSDFEKDRIATTFGSLDRERLVTVYNGVGDHFRPVTDAAVLAKARVRYKLPERFFFFLGNTHPKKNTFGTLKAFSSFKKSDAHDTKLVMLDYDKEELTRMLAEIGDPDLVHDIVLTGYVDNKDLPAIYSLCRLFLYPSLRESFGIPIIEAMGCGAPVITSTTSSMPEVAGDAAFLVDPFQPAELAHAMMVLDGDDQWRDRMSDSGKARAAAFSWRKAAERMRDIYENTLKN